jgi:Enolase C-terminal domain-like
MDHLHSISEVARATRVPIAVGETRGGRADFRALLELEALSMLIMDVTWGGGVSEARKVAAMAEAWHVPVAFHDCTGPVALAVSTHLALHARNCCGDGARLLLRLVPPLRYRAAAGGEGPDHGAGGAGPRARPATRDRATPGRCRAAHDAQRSLRRPPSQSRSGAAVPKHAEDRTWRLFLNAFRPLGVRLLDLQALLENCHQVDHVLLRRRRRFCARKHDRDTDACSWSAPITVASHAIS